MNDKDILVCRLNHCNAGFFAQVVFVINQILYAERNNLEPVVFLGKDACDGDNAYHDETYGDNVWEYYFEPLGGVDYETAISNAKKQGRVILTCPYWKLWRLHHHEPRSVFTYPYGMWSRKTVGVKNVPSWWKAQRQRASRVVQKHIRVKRDILDEVNRFVKTHFSGKMLGIHLRGTDKTDVGSGPVLSRIVPPDEYIPHIRRYFETNPNSKVFVATDQMQFRKRIVETFGDRAIYYSSNLSTTGQNVFKLEGMGQNFTKGKEVLVDCLLLSKCNHLLKCTSAVGEFATYFNRFLSCEDLNYNVPDALTAKATSYPSRVRELWHYIRVLWLWRYDVLGYGRLPYEKGIVNPPNMRHTGP